jgi:uncharacterized membrane protein YfcA
MAADVFIGLAAFGVALVTLLSGFGLGTLLLPAFALLFPAATAVAATAVVHALNNLFKIGLLWRNVDRGILLRFGVPAVLAAIPGAWLLGVLAVQAPLAEWRAGPLTGLITPVGLALGGLILLFAFLELGPAVDRLRFGPRWLPVGGVLSGFFGGVSGHQGALRAAFLAPLGLPPAVFAATQAAMAVLVDAARLTVYGTTFPAPGTGMGDEPLRPVVVATLCAFAGSWTGRRLLHKVTVPFIQKLTGVLLLVVGVLLVVGLV